LVELFWQAPATHRFLLCHVDRPESDYTVDFSADAWLDYVPSLRPPFEVVVSKVLRSSSIDDEPASAAVTIERSSHTVGLDAFGAAVLDLVDGATSIRHIVHETSETGARAGWDASDHVANARSFFQRMAEWDHFQFEIP
jgi:hypothetical protein